MNSPLRYLRRAAKQARHPRPTKPTPGRRGPAVRLPTPHQTLHLVRRLVIRLVGHRHVFDSGLGPCYAAHGVVILRCRCGHIRLYGRW